MKKWVVERTGENFNPDFLTSRDLHEWVSFMQTVEKLAPATINTRVAAIKVYWSYLVQAGYSTLNPTIKVKRKRISPLAQALRWLNRLEQDKFLHQIHKEKNAWKKTRNLATSWTQDFRGSITRYRRYRFKTPNNNRNFRKRWKESNCPYEFRIMGMK
ncbi:hypothetical protein ACW0JX_26890 (plasmid) [Bacillus sp. C-3-6]